MKQPREKQSEQKSAIHSHFATYATEPDELGRIQFHFYAGQPESLPLMLSDSSGTKKCVNAIKIPKQYRQAVNQYLADDNEIQQRHWLGCIQFSLNKQNADRTHNYPKGKMGERPGSRGLGSLLALAALDHLEKEHAIQNVGVFGKTVKHADTKKGEISLSSVAQLKYANMVPNQYYSIEEFRKGMKASMEKSRLKEFH